MSGEMVRALIAGRKTRTRRVITNAKLLELCNFVGGEPTDDPTENRVGCAFMRDGDWKDEHGIVSRYTGYYIWCDEYPEEGSIKIECPYGFPGDELWMRETARLLDESDGETRIQYRADGSFADLPEGIYSDTHATLFRWIDWQSHHENQWRPSIHVPKWASRLRRDLVRARIKRAQDITEEEAWAEGCEKGDPTDNGGWFPKEQPIPAKRGQWPGMMGWDCARDWYADLWNEINGQRKDANGTVGTYAWEKNPWVWDLEMMEQTA